MFFPFRPLRSQRRERHFNRSDKPVRSLQHRQALDQGGLAEGLVERAFGGGMRMARALYVLEALQQARAPALEIVEPLAEG